VKTWSVFDLEIEDPYYYGEDDAILESITEEGEFEFCMQEVLKRMGKAHLTSWSPVLDGDVEDFVDCSCINDEARISQNPKVDWITKRPDYVMHVIDKKRGASSMLCLDYPYVYCFFAWYNGDDIYVRRHKTGKCNLCDYISDSKKTLTFTTTFTIDVVVEVSGNTGDALNVAIDHFESALEDRLDNVCEDVEEYLGDDDISVPDYIKTNHTLDTRSAGR
jgi:hypothetical protein